MKIVRIFLNRSSSKSTLPYLYFDLPRELVYGEADYLPGLLRQFGYLLKVPLRSGIFYLQMHYRRSITFRLRFTMLSKKRKYDLAKVKKVSSSIDWANVSLAPENYQPATYKRGSQSAEDMRRLRLTRTDSASEGKPDLCQMANKVCVLGMHHDRVAI